MISISQENVANRLMKYVRIDTQSDAHSKTYPSTEKQKNLAKVLFDELGGMGMVDVHKDEYGYVYATLPANTNKNVPTIAFCSHMDTTSDCSGTNVEPIFTRCYDGGDIKFPKDENLVLNTQNSPYLKEHINSGIITASGDTLLGADDKSGIAAIMEAMFFFIQNPSLKHGTIKVVFTPDEEIGRGTDKIDLKRLNANYAYTLDGGEAGSLEDETFSADGAQIKINGVIAHPGDAKGKMENALKIAGEILAALPKNEFCPEATEGYEGFVHPTEIKGNAESATINFIVRDFVDDNLTKHHNRLYEIAENVIKNYKGSTIEYTKYEQYRNMKNVLQNCYFVVEYAEEAIKRAGLNVKKMPIRGGTDGSRLSHMGLPCPNIFTGMQNIHSRKEWIGVKDMAKAAETIVHLCMIWEEKS